MKKIYTKMVASLLLCAGLASCEMKEEILGNHEIPSETGLVEVGISVHDKMNNITKSAEGGDVIQGTSVDPSDYPVTFTLQGQDYIKSFDTYKELQEANPVELPIGTYIVDAHTPGSLQKEMTYPFYAGETNLEIKKDLKTTGQVVCSMQNTRIKLTITDAFAAAFSTWTITIDDGSEAALSFTEADGKNPDPVYWVIKENCKSLQMNVTATNTKGDPITESRSITKPDGAADMNWIGGDALDITMEPGPDPEEPEEPTGVSGIIIKISAFFETEEEETVEIPIETTPTEPTDPSDPEETTNLTITYPKQSYTLPADINENADVLIDAEAGIKSVWVKITPGNDSFGEALNLNDDLAQLKTGVELVKNETIQTYIQIIAPSVTVPQGNEISYKFPVGGFFEALSSMGATTGNGHIFEIKVTDNNNQSKSATLYVKYEQTEE